jgi:hypothetical protein
MVIKANAAKAQVEREGAELRLQEQHRELVAEVQSQRDRPTLAKQEVERKHRTNAREMRQEMSEREAEVPRTLFHPFYLARRSEGFSHLMSP